MSQLAPYLRSRIAATVGIVATILVSCDASRTRSADEKTLDSLEEFDGQQQSDLQESEQAEEESTSHPTPSPSPAEENPPADESLHPLPAADLAECLTRGVLPEARLYPTAVTGLEGWESKSSQPPLEAIGPSGQGLWRSGSGSVELDLNIQFASPPDGFRHLKAAYLFATLHFSDSARAAPWKLRLFPEKTQPLHSIPLRVHIEEIENQRGFYNKEVELRIINSQDQAAAASIREFETIEGDGVFGISRPSLLLIYDTERLQRTTEFHSLLRASSDITPKSFVRMQAKHIHPDAAGHFSLAMSPGPDSFENLRSVTAHVHWRAGSQPRFLAFTIMDEHEATPISGCSGTDLTSVTGSEWRTSQLLCRPAVGSDSLFHNHSYWQKTHLRISASGAVDVASVSLEMKFDSSAMTGLKRTLQPIADGSRSGCWWSSDRL